MTVILSPHFRRSFCFTGLFCLTGMAVSHPATAANIVTQWNNVALQAIRDTRPGPPIVARDLFLVQNSVFDAWTAYDHQAQSTTSGGGYRRPIGERTLANKEKAISYAAYRTLVNLFPSQKTSFDTFLTGLGYDPNDTSIDLTTAVGIGNVAAQRIIAFRQNDGSNQYGGLNGGAPYSDYTNYTPVNTSSTVNDINRWQPLNINGQDQRYIAPFFGQVTPFALTAYNQIGLPAPKFYDPLNPGSVDSQAFIAQTQAVIDFSANLTDEQKTIAEYWADGPGTEAPPGHWNLFAQEISERDNHTVDEDAKMFFALTGAVFDAGVAAWGYKREYDYVRPVTAVRTLFAGQQISAWAGPTQGTQLILGENWTPYQSPNLVTPPFAEYVSGHSTFSSAAAEVLRQFTGSDAFGYSVFIPSDSPLHFETGLSDVTLTWDTFTAAAQEAGISRLYGGIHFSDGNVNGFALGQQVGANAYSFAESFFVPEPLTIMGASTAIAFGAAFKRRRNQH